MTWKRNLGTTVLVVSHDQNLVELFGKRVIAIDEGVVVRDDGDDMEEEAVQKVLSVLMSSADELKNTAGTEASLSLETCREGIAIPYHPGAAAFYRENGIAVEMEAAE